MSLSRTPTSTRSAFQRWPRGEPSTGRTAVYGPVCTVVWEGRSREAPPYPYLSLCARVVWKRWHQLLPLCARIRCSVLMSVGDGTLNRPDALRSGREASRTESKRVEESRTRPGTRIGKTDLISVGCGTMIAWFPKPGVARSSRAGGARDFGGLALSSVPLEMVGDV